MSTDEEKILRAVISLVPQWYTADCGPVPLQSQLGDTIVQYYSHRRPTPKLYDFVRDVLGELRPLVAMANADSSLFFEFIQERGAVRWLKRHDALVDWPGLISYLSALSRRTHENVPVSVNLVVSSGEGSFPVPTQALQKAFDQLATSPFTYLRIDKRLRYLGYEEIAWSQVRDATSYHFHPQFLHPLHCILHPGEFSAHLTTAGDIVIMSTEGLLASRRKGRWKIYDLATFKNSLADCLHDYSAGANLFELVFDLSFRRHGALLVYDPRHQVLDRITNAESRFDYQAPSAQSIVAPHVRSIAVANGVNSLTNKRLLAELASIDGAVIFDDRNLLAAGAIVKTHESVSNQQGARTTAAWSAFRWGGRPIKVSSDGQVTYYFESEGEGRSCEATIEFL